MLIRWSGRATSEPGLKGLKRVYVSVETRMAECYQWKANGHCSRGDSCSVSHGSNRGHRLTEESLRKALAPAGKKVLLEGKVRKRALSGCKFGDQRLFWHTEADGQPSKKSKKSCRKGSVASLKESKHLLCVPRYRATEEVYSAEERNLGSNCTVTFSKGTWHHKKSGKKCWAKKKSKHRWTCILCDDPGTPQGWLQPMEKCKQVKKHKYTFTTLSSSWRCQSSMTRLLSLGKLCEEHGCTCKWAASGPKPHLTENGKRMLCKTENFVPVVVQGLSSMLKRKFVFTSLPQGSSSTSPSPTRLRSDCTHAEASGNRGDPPKLKNKN